MYKKHLVGIGPQNLETHCEPLKCLSNNNLEVTKYAMQLDFSASVEIPMIACAAPCH